MLSLGKNTLGERGADFMFALTRSKGVAWAPTNLGSKLIAWWVADRTDLITLSGAQVTSWKDVVAGYDLTQTISSQRPLLSASSFGGSPGVTFDGVDDCLVLEGVPAAFPIANVGSEVWGLLGQDRAGSDTSYSVAFAYGNSSNERRSLDRISVSSQSQLRAQSTGMARGPTDTFDGRHLARAEFPAGIVAGSLDNGTPVSGAIVHSTSNHRVRVGATPYSSPSSFWKGPVKEFVVVAPLTTGEADQLATYLLARRNI